MNGMKVMIYEYDYDDDDDNNNNKLFSTTNQTL